MASAFGSRSALLSGVCGLSRCCVVAGLLISQALLKKFGSLAISYAVCKPVSQMTSVAQLFALSFTILVNFMFKLLHFTLSLWLYEFEQLNLSVWRDFAVSVFHVQISVISSLIHCCLQNTPRADKNSSYVEKDSRGRLVAPFLLTLQRKTNPNLLIYSCWVTGTC